MSLLTLKDLTAMTRHSLENLTTQRRATRNSKWALSMESKANTLQRASTTENLSFNKRQVSFQASTKSLTLPEISMKRKKKANVLWKWATQLRKIQLSNSSRNNSRSSKSIPTTQTMMIAMLKSTKTTRSMNHPCSRPLALCTRWSGRRCTKIEMAPWKFPRDAAHEPSTFWLFHSQLRSGWLSRTQWNRSRRTTIQSRSLWHPCGFCFTLSSLSGSPSRSLKHTSFTSVCFPWLSTHSVSQCETWRGLVTWKRRLRSSELRWKVRGSV